MRILLPKSLPLILPLFYSDMNLLYHIYSLLGHFARYGSPHMSFKAHILCKASSFKPLSVSHSSTVGIAWSSQLKAQVWGSYEKSMSSTRALLRCSSMKEMLGMRNVGRHCDSVRVIFRLWFTDPTRKVSRSSNHQTISQARLTSYFQYWEPLRLLEVFK